MPELALTGKSKFLKPLWFQNVPVQSSSLISQLDGTVDMRAAWLAAALETTAPSIPWCRCPLQVIWSFVPAQTILLTTSTYMVKTGLCFPILEGITKPSRFFPALWTWAIIGAGSGLFKLQQPNRIR